MGMNLFEELVEVLSDDIEDPIGAGFSCGPLDEYGFDYDSEGDFRRELRWILDTHSNSSPGITFKGSPIELVEQYGGEGLGDNLWMVIQFEDRNIKVAGYYSSWEGEFFQDAFEVEPVEYTAVRWDRVR